MSAADQQSLNAVKAALQNAQARSEGCVARGQGEQPFVCATVGLRISDLQAVVRLADDLSTAQAQRDELLEGVEKLVEGLSEETRKRQLAEVALAEVTRDRNSLIGRGIGDDAYITGLEERVNLADAIAANNKTTAELLTECDTLRAEVERLKREAATVANVLGEALTGVVMTIAFLGRDLGTDRMEGTAKDLIDEAARLDPKIRAALTLVTSEPAPVEPKRGIPVCSAVSGFDHEVTMPVEPKPAGAPCECPYRIDMMERSFLRDGIGRLRCRVCGGAPRVDPADVRARMDADRKAAEPSITVGTRVIHRNEYRRSECGPGKVISIDTERDCFVRWDNGESSYIGMGALEKLR